MSGGPSIAVIVPNRNDSRYLERCLRSVLDQEVPPDELIVVDDQSTDDSVALIQSLIRGNPRARFFQNPENRGANRTVNESLERARSDYVLLLSANDFILPGMFARAKACLARAPGAGLWSAMAWLVDEAGHPVRLHPSPVVALNDAFLPAERCVRLAIRHGNWFTGTTLTYDRAALMGIGGFDPGYGAPADLLTALTIASLRGAAYSPEPFAAIRLHAGSYSARNLNDIAALDAMLERLRARGPQLSPRLYGDAFHARTASRFYFAAVRAAQGGMLSEVAGRRQGWERAALRFVDRLVPAALRRVRTGLAFLVLRPFDVVPAFLGRALGWSIVRLRLMLRGEGPPRA